MDRKIDYKKEYKELYLPKQTPSLVMVPAMNFLMVDGMGAPEEADYQEALQLLYSVTFTIKMSKMTDMTPEGYVDYVLPPLEGLWELCGDQMLQNRSLWKWTSMIRQPEFVTDSVLQWAVEEAKKKHPELPYHKLYRRTFEEGLSAQILHRGPYSEEQKSIDILTSFIREQGYETNFQGFHRHHEIYLSDPRRTKPENLKTVLRHPIKK